MRFSTLLLLAGLEAGRGFQSPGLLLLPRSSSATRGSGARGRAVLPGQPTFGGNHQTTGTQLLPPTVLAAASSILGDITTLPSKKVVDAVSSGGAFTTADVAATTGADLAKTKQDLTTLAALLAPEATLDVSEDGDIIYRFPRNADGALASRSRAAQIRRWWVATKPQVFTVIRGAFGVALFVSIAVVFAAITAISSSSRSQDDDRRDRSPSYGGGYYGGGFGFGGSPFYYGPSPFDVFFYRPYYSYRDEVNEPPRLGILESIFSYVFGDGDPNYDIDNRSLRAAANMIRQNGGAVTAEQLAPYFAPPTAAWNDKERVTVDEAWVLPVLTRLQGTPQVTDDGHIIYVFEDLQATTGSSNELVEDYIEEAELEFSAADGFGRALAGGLGLLNLAGVAYLGLQLASLPANLILPPFLATVKSLYPLLLVYAVAFNAVPLVRALAIGKKNQEISKRNRIRRFAASVLRSGGEEVQGKLSAARRFATSLKRVGGAGTVAYSTSDEFAEKALEDKKLDDLLDFDSRLKGGGGDKR